MPVLGAQKQALLNQVKNQTSISLQTLVDLINRYDDLEINDFQGYIDEVLLGQLHDACRNPKELELWNQIMNNPRNTPEEIQDVQRKVATYVQLYPKAPKIKEAMELMNRLPQELTAAIKKKNDEAAAAAVAAAAAQAAAREQQDWDMLERGNYNALLTYKSKYPSSVHMDELDDLMWLNTKNVMNVHSLNRYLSDWPLGRHAEEANQALSESSEWEEVKRSGNLFRVDDYRDNHPTSPYINEVNALYYKLREEELAKMKENPSEYSRDDVEKLIAADIFTKWQLEDEGLITEESWEMLQLDRDLFPNIQDFMIEDPNIQAMEDCTDIYLFGTPGTGKTCLLMGLTGANGEGYALNMKTHGGAYAAALQEYANAGLTPGNTYGKFVTTINGQVTETDKRGNVIDHRINLVEMSGEEFALRIADSKEVSLSNMGTGATNLLQNDNRKVFFIIVDCSKDKVKVEYIEQVKDSEGNVVDEHIRKKYISQLSTLNKFVSLFELPENQEIMKRVDAIHFVVTKADMLGDTDERKTKARDLLQSIYAGPVAQLKNYCRKTKRINISTDYRPQVFTFSLGKFYLGDVFNFDKSETVQIINTIRDITGGSKEETWWDKLKRTIG